MILCAKIRLVMNKMSTPAAVKICEAIATLTSLGLDAQTILMDRATIRAMQKPKSRTEKKNLYDLRRLRWKMVMFVAAPATKRARKMAQMGMSGVRPGTPPEAAVGGGKGPLPAIRG